ncbi:hypothetical protein C8E87_5622 [Paractinoplanes brasiliensis]|uniref:Uncharacterized protein n=2 Tax=Paractinoplanes brasiliensis TaxID=52695 RepID=A0A4R6JZK7_9ACTN|nr:hypothetical protein C8E87_5622 [Actinoplanes brasiliensis]
MRGGRSRWARVRPQRLPALVMILLALSAGVLVSAGSAHHTTGTAEATTVADAAVVQAPLDHEHHHGSEWTPTPSHRLHPVATVAAVSAAPARPEADVVPVDESFAAAPPPLALSGVLRV